MVQLHVQSCGHFNKICLNYKTEEDQRMNQPKYHVKKNKNNKQNNEGEDDPK